MFRGGCLYYKYSRHNPLSVASHPMRKRLPRPRPPSPSRHCSRNTPPRDKNIKTKVHPENCSVRIPINNIYTTYITVLGSCGRGRGSPGILWSLGMGPHGFHVNNKPPTASLRALAANKRFGPSEPVATRVQHQPRTLFWECGMRRRGTTRPVATPTSSFALGRWSAQVLLQP